MAPLSRPPASPSTEAQGCSGSSETLQALMSSLLPSSYPGQGLHRSPAASSTGLFQQEPAAVSVPSVLAF